MKLRKPIELRSPSGDLVETITEIVIAREPVAGDLMGLPIKLEMTEMLTLVSRLSGHPMSTINRLSIPDAMALIEEVAVPLAGSAE